MCTVSIFYKKNNNFILTSNRDEAPNRIPLFPDFYKTDTINILMPKDEVSNGSWIGASSKNRVVCLLNGGFKKHERNLPYRISRGVVVNDFLKMPSILNLTYYNFSNIEPFTIVITDWNSNLKFIEVVWNGLKVSITNLDLIPKIWSSSTLYNEVQKEERFMWFYSFY